MKIISALGYSTQQSYNSKLMEELKSSMITETKIIYDSFLNLSTKKMKTSLNKTKNQRTGNIKPQY
jgi:hypothetical protein